MYNKTVAVQYFSKTGNTKKLAEEIAKITGCKAQLIDKPIKDQVDVLFLGASVYWGGVDNQVKEFIRLLDAKKIKKVAVFSTSALAERAYPQISKLLRAQGIPTEKRHFYCRGQFTVLHHNRPNAEDLKAVREYAKAVCNQKQV